LGYYFVAAEIVIGRVGSFSIHVQMSKAAFTLERNAAQHVTLFTQRAAPRGIAFHGLTQSHHLSCFMCCGQVMAKNLSGSHNVREARIACRSCARKWMFTLL